MNRIDPNNDGNVRNDVTNKMRKLLVSAPNLTDVDLCVPLNANFCHALLNACPKLRRLFAEYVEPLVKSERDTNLEPIEHAQIRRLLAQSKLSGIEAALDWFDNDVALLVARAKTHPVQTLRIGVQSLSPPALSAVFALPGLRYLELTTVPSAVPTELASDSIEELILGPCSRSKLADLFVPALNLPSLRRLSGHQPVRINTVGWFFQLLHRSPQLERLQVAVNTQAQGAACLLSVLLCSADVIRDDANRLRTVDARRFL